ncbi:hypothetical protein DSAG12_01115 [Promethearchaeum syntrophicum]|uniref:Uncharacterized protein n=1 Tax=Promethearchaeum syntrophicum TaxID=2594042 RepID=A0A5B9D965_9ARCH|nr:hypothetical protein [Candidatus Prometheoarchaeum syntrophicum]QEE15290.1 Leucine Rich repeats (2 copies) [Candidatus Prometheoarchaeum syntrophicum]
MAIINIVEEEKKLLKELSTETGIQNIENKKYIKLKEGRVVSLSLNNLDLKSIPSSVFKFRYLEDLYLDHNKLITISNEICNLKNLQLLSFSHNFFEKLPDILRELYSLSVLVFSDNPLYEIPDWIESLFQLVEIHMGPLKKYNNLPEIMKKLKNIIYLDTDDEIWEENSVINNFFKGVKFLPSEIEGIKILEEITNEKMNELYEWDELKSEKKHLGLICYRDKIIALKAMNLSYSELPPEVDSFYALNYLKCKGDWDISHLPRLSNLFNYGIRLESEETKALLELESFLGKKIPYRDMALINNWGNIHGDHVDLGFDIRANHVVCLSLENLNLSEIPKIIIKFPYLRILNLTNNNIRELPEWLAELKLLTTIFLYFDETDEEEGIIKIEPDFLDGIKENNELQSWYQVQHLQDISFENKITFQDWIDQADEYVASDSNFADFYISEEDWHKLYLAYIPLAELIEAPIFCPQKCDSKIILIHVNLNAFKDHIYDFYSIIYQKLAQHVWAYYYNSISPLFGDQKATVWDFHKQNSELIYALIEPESNTKVWAFASPSFETCFAFQEYCMSNMMGKVEKTRDFSTLTHEMHKLIEGGKQMMNRYPLDLRELQNELYKYRI